MMKNGSLSQGKYAMKISRFSLAIVFIAVVCITGTSFAGNKRIMSVKAAKVIAERALVESIYGLKLRATESVENMVAASFEGTTESKTKALIKGIRHEEVVYDPETDIATATASVSLPSITNIDGQEIILNNKVFRRVGFATSTPSQAGKLKAMRAAELDAYKQLVKQVVGFELESQTSVENYMLTSDTVKTKVLATIYLAELIDYGWDEYGDAYVVLQLNLTEANDMLGQDIQSDTEIIEVTGQGSTVDDFSAAK